MIIGLGTGQRYPLGFSGGRRSEETGQTTTAALGRSAMAGTFAVGLGNDALRFGKEDRKKGSWLKKLSLFLMTAGTLMVGGGVTRDTIRHAPQAAVLRQWNDVAQKQEKHLRNTAVFSLHDDPQVSLDYEMTWTQADWDHRFWMEATEASHDGVVNRVKSWLDQPVHQTQADAVDAIIRQQQKAGTLGKLSGEKLHTLVEKEFAGQYLEVVLRPYFSAMFDRMRSEQITPNGQNILDIFQNGKPGDEDLPPLREYLAQEGIQLEQLKINSLTLMGEAGNSLVFQNKTVN